jgi:dihydropteroate synthase
MGVLNVTPDSFSDGGKYSQVEKAVARAWEIQQEGADILDVGGESTRPGADPVGCEEELRRITPVLDAIAGSYPIPISIDTSKAEVAAAAMDRGACIINDISALSFDPMMAEIASRTHAGLILMHMRGEPRNMQQLPPSTDIIREIESWAPAAIKRARERGILAESIVLDPGVGFGKTAEQNLTIIANLGSLAALDFPLLIGASRKAFIGAVLGDPCAERIWGTAAVVAAAIYEGAHVVRVHDVAAMRKVALLTDAIIQQK